MVDRRGSIKCMRCVPFDSLVKGNKIQLRLVCIFLFYDPCRAVDAFEGQIASAVEEAIPEKIGEEITKLDSKLQDLPQEMPVGEAAALNVTFMKSPVLSDSSIDLEIDGLFTALDHNIAVLESPPRLLEIDGLFTALDHSIAVLERSPPRLSPSSPSCSGAAEMIQISLHENVLKSASSVYFNVSYSILYHHFS